MRPLATSYIFSYRIVSPSLPGIEYPVRQTITTCKHPASFVPPEYPHDDVERKQFLSTNRAAYYTIGVGEVNGVPE
jgi:hypothetical protein